MAFVSNRPYPGMLAKYPVPIELISALYHAGDREFSQLLDRMPEHGRARIAVYCAEKERLQPLGLKVARSCDEAALVRAAGLTVGASLFKQSRAEAEASDQLQAA